MVATNNDSIVLIQMPFAMTSWPALGLSLLKSCLARAGIGATIRYFNSAFAERIGFDAYAPISRGSPQTVDLLGEWIFSEALWGADEERDRTYYAMITNGGEIAHKKDIDQEALDRIWQLALKGRAAVAAFIADCVERCDWSRCGIVGFTSVFQQHVASLVLARELKKRFPSLTVVFGGANCEGAMGAATLANFHFVDAVCTGEGDSAFVEFARSVLDESPAPVAGFLIRALGDAAPPQPPTPVDMNSLPYPDFDDFFDQCAARLVRDPHPARLVFETSRGCWWGQKNHCTFCGLNGSTMAFREKTGDRAIAEIRHLLDKYGGFTRYLAATDNIIPYRYFREFLPKLAQLGMNIDIFYETKSNLRKEQVALYRQAGLLEIQPGIESLDSDVLKLMRKGVSCLQNVQLLVWCKEFGILPHWNYIVGFPGEKAQSYVGKGSLIDKLRHLTPPTGASRLRFDRFSPYFMQPTHFGVSELRPYPAYAFVYAGLPTEQVADFAYYFVANYENRECIEDYTRELIASLKVWQRESESFMLSDLATADTTTLFDTRDPMQAEIVFLVGLYHRIFALCRQIRALESLFTELAAATVAERAAIVDALAALVARGFVLEEDKKYLVVSVPWQSSYQPGAKALARLKELFTTASRDENGNAMTLTTKHKVKTYGLNNNTGGRNDADTVTRAFHGHSGNRPARQFDNSGPEDS